MDVKEVECDGYVIFRSRPNTGPWYRESEFRKPDIERTRVRSRALT